MNRYIALLRGVNVGGKNRVPMPELKAAFEGAGFADVVTYINSGNVLFSCEDGDVAALKGMCERAIADAFGLDIPVAVLRSDELRDALNHAPDWWGLPGDAKHNALFVIPPADARSVMDAVGSAKPEYERVASHGGVIFWSAPRKTFSRTRYAKIAGMAVYESVTIRNANTARRLGVLAGEG